MDIFLFCATAAVYRFTVTASLHTTRGGGSQPTTVLKAGSSIGYGLLKLQNAETSTALVDALSESPAFTRLSTYEGDLTTNRDKEDAFKLDVGIDFAKSKGVIDRNFKPEPYVEIDVLGKSPDEVADQILESVKSNASGGGGAVIVLVGLSGTGKGTTVSELSTKLGAQGKQVVTWSNGNLFRSVTLLATTWAEQQGMDTFNAESVLTKENLESFMSMLSFGLVNGQYDTRIKGLGLDYLVSQVQNTVLKSPTVSKNIPTVAQFTQGEVILFAADAVKTMGQAKNLVVLLEGRQQTVDYVRTPHRFHLMLSDPTLIGKRRAAQRLMGAVLSQVAENASAGVIAAALVSSLDKMVSEIE